MLGFWGRGWGYVLEGWANTGSSGRGIGVYACSGFVGLVGVVFREGGIQGLRAWGARVWGGGRL